MEYLFPILAFIMILSAFGVVGMKNPIYSALCLILHMLTVAGVFASLEAHFLAAVQIIVYAGAIMVLVVFVLMLLNYKTEETTTRQTVYLISALIAGGLFLFMLVPYVIEIFGSFSHYKELDGSLAAIGKLLYTKYVFAFEACGVLLTAALVGAVMIARRNPTEGVEE